MQEIEKKCAIFIITLHHIILRKLITIFEIIISKACLLTWLNDFADVFNKEKTAILTNYFQVKHAINLKSNIQSSHKSIYNFSEIEFKILYKYLKISLKKIEFNHLKIL